MRNYLSRLKKISLLLTAYFVCCSCTDKTAGELGHASTRGDNGPDLSYTRLDTPSAQMSSFFLNTLRGDTGLFKGNDLTFPIEKLESEKQDVWEAWKDANNRFPEDKLIDFVPLNNGASGMWTLPESLEPNARMSYYLGTKGVLTPPMVAAKEVLEETGFPLFLYLHGSGDRDFEWQNALTLCKSFNDSPSAYFIPRIPNVGEYYRWYQKSKQFAWEKLFRLSFLSRFVNQNRIYITGVSEGGYGSQSLASYYADYLAGAGPMAGGVPLIGAPVENCRNIAFSLQTGILDYDFCRSALTAKARDEFARLQNEEGDGSYIHRIELISDHAHIIPYGNTTPWLRQYRRNPYPHIVTWENFPLDGVYRKGFYNLVVDKPADPEGRMYYDMRINNNNIVLNVHDVVYEQTLSDPIWHLGLEFTRSYSYSESGRVTVFLCSELVSLEKPVTLIVNGKIVFRGMLELKRSNLINSCAAFSDPARLYPAAIEVNLADIHF